jgi:hypothetical protein
VKQPSRHKAIKIPISSLDFLKNTFDLSDLKS